MLKYKKVFVYILFNRKERIFMTKKILCALLTASLIISMAGCSGNNTSSASSSASTSSTENSSESAGSEQPESSADAAIDFDSDPYEVHFLYIVAAEGSNQADINDAVNELTMKELNMSVDMMPMTYGNTYSTISVMLAANDNLDICPFWSSSFPTYIESGYIVNLYDYEQYFDGIKEQMGDVFYAGDVDGFLCGFTELKEQGFPCGLVIRNDILEGVGRSVEEFTIDKTDLSTLSQLDELFSQIKEAYPGLTPVGGTGIMGTLIYSWVDGLGNNFGVLDNFGQDTNVTNWYESDQYYQIISTANRWFTNGYLSADAATNTDGGEILMKAGNIASFVTYYKPNTTVEKKAQTGYDVSVIPITDEGFKSNAVLSALVYGMANASVDKTKAAQFMNFIYTNGDFMDLINWGIKGVDWVEDENGQAAYPEGIDATNVATHNDFGWAMPNQFVGHAWAGNPIDIWDQYREYNDAQPKTAAFGFSFNSTVVTDQVANCTSVEAEYQKPLAFGAVNDLDATLAEFNEKLYAAGLQDIMDAKQEQFNDWLANQ